MRLPLRRLEIENLERSASEMERIGVTPAGVKLMAGKHLYHNFKLRDLTPPQGNIIKQEILSIGGDLAVSKGTVGCMVEFTDGILSGTDRQLRRLSAKLKSQPYKLKSVGEALESALDHTRAGTSTLLTRSLSYTFTPESETFVMGILNVTPDSFSDGGSYPTPDDAVKRGLQMAHEGACWIDVGGESTRPGGGGVPLEEELKRVMPVVEGLVKEGLVVSIDTTKSGVARRALEAGAEIVNDVSALTVDPEMAGVVSEFGAGVVLMHMRGTPESMQQNTEYGDITEEVIEYLYNRLVFCQDSGIDMERTLIDPGIGFGKSLEGNLELLARLKEFRSLGRPIMVGLSRKSFIGTLIGSEAGPGAGAEEGGRLYGTLAADTAAVLNGASVLRLHDVKAGVEGCRVVDGIRSFL